MIKDRFVVIDGEKELFRSSWEEAKKIIGRLYLKGLPESHEKILEDWYIIRLFYIKEGLVEQFVGQQKEFNKQYGSDLDSSPVLVSAVAVITATMNRDIRR